MPTRTSQGYTHSVEECDEIISDYEMKDVQVLSKVSTVHLLQGLASQCKAQEKERMDLGVTWLK